MTDKNEKKPAEKVTEFDTNPILRPFKGCLELESVTFYEGVVLNGSATKRAHGIARSEKKDRMFLRKIDGIPFVVHVDLNAKRGMPTHSPLTNVAGVVFRMDRLVQEETIAQAEAEAQAAVEAKKAEQLEALKAQEARKAQAREAAQS